MKTFQGLARDSPFRPRGGAIPLAPGSLVASGGMRNHAFNLVTVIGGTCLGFPSPAMESTGWQVAAGEKTLAVGEEGRITNMLTSQIIKVIYRFLTIASPDLPHQLARLPPFPSFRA
jgi:hypothetical protein